MSDERLLRVEAPHFVAGAVWQRAADALASSADAARWRCVRAAPILAWMVGKSGAEVLPYMARKGWRWHWL